MFILRIIVLKNGFKKYNIDVSNIGFGIYYAWTIYENYKC